MTINPPENKPETALPQDKVDTNISQQKVDTNLSQTQPQESKVEEDNVDPNWRAFREARKKDRAEKEAAERRATEKEQEAAALKAAMEAAFGRQGQPPAPNGNYNQGYAEEESEDERIEKKVNAIVAKREETARRDAEEREHREYPQRLAQTYSDYNSVITTENLDYLEYHYPEIARPLKRMQDGFDKWSDIYHNVKKFVPNSTTSRKESAKADSNFSKPKSISSTGMIQPQTVQESNRISQDKKDDNWARMQRLLKSVQ